MNTTMIKRFLIAFVAITAITLSSCKKEKYDEPSGNTPDPNLTTITIDSLRKYFTSGLPITITNDVTISGIVTADDKDGNFYKQIVIDDGTAGIPVLIERSYLYTDFPQGRKIYVKCKGLVLGAYHNYLQLGGFVDNSTGQPAVGNIPSDLADKVIVKGPTGNTVTPIVVSSSQLNNSYQARLVQLDPVIFQASDQGQPWANIITQQSMSRIASECYSDPIEVRTSNYALFANSIVPSGSQKIVGIYSVYNSTKQLALRNLSDVTSSSILCPTYLFENFEAASTSNIPDWLNISTAGVKTWTIGGTTNKNAEFNAFSSGEASNIGWLISPQLNFNVYAHDTLSFRMEVAFNATGTLLEVLHSSDYTGSGSPSSATWNVLATMPNVNQSWSSVTPISLDALTGTGYIAFRYTGSGTGGQTTRYRVDDVRIKGNN